MIANRPAAGPSPTPPGPKHILEAPSDHAPGPRYEPAPEHDPGPDLALAPQSELYPDYEEDLLEDRAEAEGRGQGSGLFGGGDGLQVGGGPAPIVVPVSVEVPPPVGPWDRLAELVDWRDLLGAPDDPTPVFRRPRVLVLLAAIAFAFSPLVATLVRSPTTAQPVVRSTSTVSPSTAPLPTLSSFETP